MREKTRCSCESPKSAFELQMLKRCDVHTLETADVVLPKDSAKFCTNYPLVN